MHVGLILHMRVRWWSTSQQTWLFFLRPFSCKFKLDCCIDCNRWYLYLQRSRYDDLFPSVLLSCIVIAWILRWDGWYFAMPSTSIWSRTWTPMLVDITWWWPSSRCRFLQAVLEPCLIWDFFTLVQSFEIDLIARECLDRHISILLQWTWHGNPYWITSSQCCMALHP